MLALSRRVSESIYIKPAKDMPDISARELFISGPIKICILGTGESFARFGIAAPDSLYILRDELQQQE